MTKRTTPRRVKAVATSRPLVFSYLSDAPIRPFWQIPRTRAAYDAMVEQMAGAAFRSEFNQPVRNRPNLYPHYEKVAIAALRAIGITRPRE